MIYHTTQNFLDLYVISNYDIYVYKHKYLAIQIKNNLIITYLNVNCQNALCLYGNGLRIVEHPTICKHKIDAFSIFVIQGHAFHMRFSSYRIDQIMSDY